MKRATRPRPLALPARNLLAWPLAFLIGTLVVVLLIRMASVEHLAWRSLAPSKDWPMALALAAAVWVVARGLREVVAHGHDAFARIARSVGVSLIAIGEMLAYVLGFLYQSPRLGHATAFAGALLAIGATLSIARRRRWLQRVRAGTVPGWAIRHLAARERPAGLLPYVAVRHAVGDEALFRVPGPVEAYREGAWDVPVALVHEERRTFLDQ